MFCLFQWKIFRIFPYNVCIVEYRTVTWLCLYVYVNLYTCEKAIYVIPDSGVSQCIFFIRSAIVSLLVFKWTHIVIDTIILLCATKWMCRALHSPYNAHTHTKSINYARRRICDRVFFTQSHMWFISALTDKILENWIMSEKKNDFYNSVDWVSSIKIRRI